MGTADAPDSVGVSDAGPARASKLDLGRLVEQLKTIGVIGSAGAGLGLLLLYLFGIVIYTVAGRFLGVQPFEPGLNTCLEVGGGFVVFFLGLLPLNLLGGAIRLWTSGAGLPLLLATPLLLALPSVAVDRQEAGRRKLRLAETGLLLALITTMILLILVYLSIAEFAGQPSNMLVDKRVNTALEQVDALRRGTPPADVGIHGWWPVTVELVTAEESQKDRRYNLYVTQSAIVLLYALLLLRHARRFIAGAGKERLRLSAALARTRRWLIGVVLFFAAMQLFALPVVLSVTYASFPIAKRVDAEIEGLEAITDRYDLVRISEVGDRFVFHVPPLQQVIVVPEKQVRHLVLKENVSLFEPRHIFVKGPWLGVRGYFLMPDGEPSDPRPPAGGFRVTRVTAGSPAAAADLFAGDVLLDLGEVELDGKVPFAEVLAGTPLDRDVGLRLWRDGETTEVAVRLEPRP